MINRTQDFLKILKTNREFAGLPAKSSIRLNYTIPPRTLFAKESLTIVSQITKLRNDLLASRKSYVGMVGSESMTNEQRDKINKESELCIKSCSNAIKELKNKQLNEISQASQHKQFTIELVSRYLRAVGELYSEQRAIWVKKVIDKKRMSMVNTESIKKRVPKDPESETVSTNRSTRTELPPKPTQPEYYFDSDDSLDTGDEEMFEQENAQIYKDMNSTINEVKSIEDKVIEIAQLQEMFNQEVFKQKEDIELVAEKVIEGSENVSGGNEEIREAIKNNAGFRVCILFFLLMCSFSLLFLEWYS